MNEKDPERNEIGCLKFLLLCWLSYLGYLLILFIILLLAILLLPTEVEAELPPPLPHSFYGDVVGSGLGARIEARNAEGTPYARTTPLYYRATLVYSMIVSGGTEGEAIKFYVDLLPAASAEWYSGHSDRLDLYPLGGATSTPSPTATSQLRLVIAAPIWRDAGQRGSIEVCAEYGAERLCVTVWLDCPRE